MALVEFSTQPLPETLLAEPDAVREQFTRVMELEIPGFVLRNVDRDLSAVGQAVRATLHPEIQLHYVVESFFEYPTSAFPEWPLHCDQNDQSGKNRRQISMHHTIPPGEVKATLFSFQPEVMERVVEAVKLGPKLLLRGDDGRLFASGQVDDEILVPVGHEARLSSDDVLIFADALCGHAFKTVTWPRKSYARTYQALYQSSP